MIAIPLLPHRLPSTLLVPLSLPIRLPSLLWPLALRYRRVQRHAHHDTLHRPVLCGGLGAVLFYRGSLLPLVCSH